MIKHAVAIILKLELNNVSSMRPLCIIRSRLIIKALGYSSETPFDQARSGVNFKVRVNLCIIRSRLIMKALGYSSETPYDQARSGVNFKVRDTCIHAISVKILKLREIYFVCQDLTS